MKTPANLFKENNDLKSFTDALVKLNGDFDFDRDCMVDLGAAYLERYPDQFSRRNIDEVRLGYNIVRACVIEKIIREFDPEKKDVYRKILNDFSASEKTLTDFILKTGRPSALKDYENLYSNLDYIQQLINDIPKGMIKERFIGGVTNIVNTVYLLKMKLEKITSDG